MAYPNNYDSFTEVKRFGEFISETINIPASSTPTVIFTKYPILRGVSVYGYTEVVTIPGPNQYKVSYRTNQITFGPTSTPVQVPISYITAGTLLADIPIQGMINAIVAIEHVLGLNPNGNYASLADRITALENINSHQHKITDLSSYCDGSLTVFSLPETPSQPEGTMVILNGSILVYNSDYIISGNNIIFNDPPSSGDSLIVHYIV